MGRKGRSGRWAAALPAVVAAAVAVMVWCGARREDPRVAASAESRAGSSLVQDSLDGSEAADVWTEDPSAQPAGVVEMRWADSARPADRERLAAMGVRFLRPAGTGREWALVPAASRRRVESDPAVAQVRVPKPREKIAEVLWAILDGAGGPVELHVGFPPHVAVAEALAALEAAGAVALETRAQLGNWWAAWGGRAEVEALARDRRVFQIWPAPGHPAPTNADAARLSKVPRVHPGGGVGPGLTGNGVTLALWDAGPVRATHQEFSGRVMVLEGSGVDGHATHVAGTIAAAGVDAAARGISFAAQIRSRDFYGSAVTEWFEDRANYAAGNNSWGYVTGWYGVHWYGPPDSPVDPRFGKYQSASSQADLACEGDDVLQVVAAGNDRGDTAPTGGHTHAGSGWYTDFHHGDDAEGGYDTLGAMAVAKNVLSVGAVDDGGAMSLFSSWGPCDDGRVKPDVVANGVGLYSSYSRSDADYAVMSGTSMSAPVVTGIVGLLVEQMRLRGYGPSGYEPPASLVKALLIHTALDLGRGGPDYAHGWGLVDAEGVVQLIEDDWARGRWARMVYSTIDPGEQESWTLAVGSAGALRVTLVWADPAGTPNTGGDDDPARALVHDLELWLVGPDGSVHRPWRLDRGTPGSPAVRGVNSVDNVEVVDVANAAEGTWTVQVSHAGALLAPQRYSLVFGAPLTDSGDGGGGGGGGGGAEPRRPPPLDGGGGAAVPSGGGGGGGGCWAGSGGVAWWPLVMLAVAVAAFRRPGAAIGCGE